LSTAKLSSLSLREAFAHDTTEEATDETCVCLLLWTNKTARRKRRHMCAQSEYKLKRSEDLSMMSRLRNALSVRLFCGSFLPIKSRPPPSICLFLSTMKSKCIIRYALSQAPKMLFGHNDPRKKQRVGTSRSQLALLRLWPEMDPRLYYDIAAVNAFDPASLATTW
jgi:hypothetical protein